MDISLLVGSEMAQDFRMERYFKGLVQLRSCLPKYDSISDPKILLDYFTKADGNEKLIFQELASKLITLLALITGQHMQTFANIKKDNIEVRDKELEI